jgi:hypothetical protein
VGSVIICGYRTAFVYISSQGCFDLLQFIFPRSILNRLEIDSEPT